MVPTKQEIDDIQSQISVMGSGPCQQWKVVCCGGGVKVKLNIGQIKTTWTWRTQTKTNGWPSRKEECVRHVTWSCRWIGEGCVECIIIFQVFFTIKKFYILLGLWRKHNTSITDVEISAINLCGTQNLNSNWSEFLMLEQFLSEGPAV